MNRSARINGKPRIFCKPEINQGAKNYLELVTYNVDIGDNDPIRKRKSFKSYRMFGLCFKTACSKFLVLANFLVQLGTYLLPKFSIFTDDYQL